MQNLRITEKEMEEIIEADLNSAGYFIREPDKYDAELCLDTEMLKNFIIATQMEKWEEYKKQLGERAEDAFLNKVKEEISKRGTLELLRKGLQSYGVYFDFVYFQPASGMNVSNIEKYKNNMFSIMRQVKYSEHSEHSLDIVLFLNGIPLITMELKDRLTGSGYKVENAIRQYQNDRDPREPLFKFGRCLVHFAVDNDQVYMTTYLQGKKTFFLPFNKGHNGNAGNPPAEGFSSEYLWKEVLRRDSLLGLLQRFIQITDKFDEDGKPTGEKLLLFPRYHQLNAVRKLIKDSKENGTGQKYLIMHSAGSGKSYTISWLAHHLSTLHDKNDNNIFDSIIVVTDRRVLDCQLRTHVMSFEQNPGVVAGIEKGSKQLRAELEAGTKIIITTLQKFPFIEEDIKALPGKRFAIIIDEAHSSSSGEMTKSMKRVLNIYEEDDEEEEDKTFEDMIIEQMESRKMQPNTSYFAFTATPKPKTLELFGVPNAEGGWDPFDLYSMKQAIQEKFIMDVLPNYTTFGTYFNLIKTIEDDPSYDKAKAIRLLKTHVELSEHTISRKTAIIIQHFMENCISELNGHAKAMMVCASRAQAVKYKIAFDKYISDNNLPFKALVAFSDEITIEGKSEKYSEARMNGFSEAQTVKKFRERAYKFLIVANKFQTGFDQPLLYAMYVNKKLKGVNAVQTISRLNRTYKGKKEPITLDFVNEAKTIEKSFQDFYEEATLTESSDPDKLYDLKRALEEYHYIMQDEVDDFNRVILSKNYSQDKLDPILNKAIARYQEDDKENRDKFRNVLRAYLRMYAFLSQIISFSDPELEKLYVYCKILFRKLPYEKQKLPREVTQQVDLDSIRVQYQNTGIQVKAGEGGEFQPGDETPAGARQEFLEPLSEILKAINERHTTNFNESDKVKADMILTRIRDNEEFREEVKNNPRDNVFWSFERIFKDELQALIDEDFDFYAKLTNNEEIRNDLMKNMFLVLYDQVMRKSS